MKKVILPVVCAVLLFIAIKLVNPNLEAYGYFFVSVLGLYIGYIINTKVFKNEAAEKSEKDSVAK